MTKIIGILNYNDDSFSDGGQYSDLEKAVRRVSQLFSSGADIVDIGVSSTSYGSKLVTGEREVAKLSPLLDRINLNNISIDTYNYETMKYCVDKGVKYINDVSGGRDKRTLKLIACHPDVKYICMYSLVLPASRNIRIKSINDIYDWITGKINDTNAIGINKEQLIIDPGIGFVTNSSQSINLLQEIDKLKSYGVKICVGHSRKSFFEETMDKKTMSRDIETLATSIYLSLSNIDYIRVHNVSIHSVGLGVLKKLIKKNN